MGDVMTERRLIAVVGATARGSSTAGLATLFQDRTGQRPHRWLMNRCFARACQLLGNPSLSITETAHPCGFGRSQRLATLTHRRRRDAGRLPLTPSELTK